MKDILQPVVRKFLPYAKKRMGFDDAPSIYLRTDPKNSESVFGKTAHYDPNEKSVVLYVHNRHPKDVLRSLSHELVHHAQNCRGEFDDMADLEEGYAQKNPHLRDMEEEAYKVGNLVFRDFEDMMKEKTIYREFLEKGETLDMSHEKWRNKELGTLLSESWGFGFDLNRLTESEETVEEGMCSGKRDKDNKCPGCPKCKPMEEAEEPIEEAEKKMVKCGDKGMVPDYACDGKGSGDLKSGGAEEKEEEEKETSEKPKKGKFPPQFKTKEKMEEAKLRAYIRKLIQESLKEG